ncbi:hypothetical protein NUW54_g4096 [Trametes sanguinea]|uniref:Uncharacterized protein n=1 Tax=Trametes sanguinea TaxID=158606 RepID=A0ACC1PYX4_9APHY|nr:hypothetical protein NUW54_g4096 [Trametes sanguinea]
MLGQRNKTFLTSSPRMSGDGARAHAEVGERGIARFVAEFMAVRPGDAEWAIPLTILHSMRSTFIWPY